MGDSEFTLAENHRVTSMKQEVLKHTANKTQRITIPPYDRKGCGGFFVPALKMQRPPSICKDPPPKRKGAPAPKSQRHSAP